VINSLLGAKLAKTSSTPGRTRSINFFEVRWPGKPAPEVIFTDLPGYGYAKISRDVSSKWPAFIDPYLNDRPCLALCLALIDVSVPPQESDKQLSEFLQSSGRPFVVVATKSDRLSGNQLRNALHKAAETLPGTLTIPFSAKTGAGKEQLWQQIRMAIDRPGKKGPTARFFRSL
jgi:GTP-binding protein